MTNKELVMKLEEDISWLEQGCTTEQEICEHIKQAIKTIIQPKETENPWHTGTPTEEGCFYALQCKGHMHPEPYFGVVVHGVFSAINWEGDLMPLPPDLIAWQKIEPYKENEDGRTD